MSEHGPHVWRADEFTMIRGRYCAVVARAWCTETEEDRWRWHVFLTDVDGCDDIVPDEERKYGLTFAAAIAAAEAFIARHQQETKLGNWAAFEGAPMPAEPEVCF